MRLNCPHCGSRDLREFAYHGPALLRDRPPADAGAEAWEAYLHLRDNPEGPSAELWHHTPCGAWLQATRDTRSHAVLDCRSP